MDGVRIDELVKGNGGEKEGNRPLELGSGVDGSGTSMSGSITSVGPGPAVVVLPELEGPIEAGGMEVEPGAGDDLASIDDAGEAEASLGRAVEADGVEMKSLDCPLGLDGETAPPAVVVADGLPEEEAASGELDAFSGDAVETSPD